ncbi:hypothetical protein SAMN05444409_2762 [Epilithonimonas zeae]|uniref:Uncharacterized protein n=1 Tax=Epilithonimonas zeae TaxID=1416779 RepID=A0A1N6IKT8_9FLAO|nr:hypothetical protein SAMN05444409_2762 [Epilithonimonas zeae]
MTNVDLELKSLAPIVVEILFFGVGLKKATAKKDCNEKREIAPKKNYDFGETF